MVLTRTSEQSYPDVNWTMLTPRYPEIGWAHSIKQFLLDYQYSQCRGSQQMFSLLRSFKQYLTIILRRPVSNSSLSSRRGWNLCQDFVAYQENILKCIEEVFWTEECRTLATDSRGGGGDCAHLPLDGGSLRGREIFLRRHSHLRRVGADRRTLRGRQRAGGEGDAGGAQHQG